jgi:hypothetical protein
VSEKLSANSEPALGANEHKEGESRCQQIDISLWF